jgi:hypothetical protein
MAKRNWVRLPTGWIEDGGLKSFTWRDRGIDSLAALMLLIAIAHRADQATGEVRVTYNDLVLATGLSRTSVAAGLGKLEGRLIEKHSQSMYSLTAFDPHGGWAILPYERLYTPRGQIKFFQDLKKRKAIELNALKLYLLFVARRDRDTNQAHISYDKIEAYTGIARDDIKPAISFLLHAGMIYYEPVQSLAHSGRLSHAYRIIGYDSYRNPATTGSAGRLFGVAIDEDA